MKKPGAYTAQWLTLRTMIRLGGEVSFRPEIGPSMMTFRRLVEAGWAESLGENKFRITEIGRQVAK